MDAKRNIIQGIAEEISPLSESAVEELAAILVRTEVKKNTLFLKEGEISDQICVVESGLVRQFYYKNGKDLTEHFTCKDGMFICIESYLLQQPTYLMVEALEPSVLYGLPYGPLMSLIKDYWEIEIMYRKIIEFSLIISQQKTDSFRFETANERYNRLLKESPEIVKRAPLVHIASYLLMSPETLSRVRANIG